MPGRGFLSKGKKISRFLQTIGFGKNEKTRESPMNSMSVYEKYYKCLFGNLANLPMAIIDAPMVLGQPKVLGDLWAQCLVTGIFHTLTMLSL